MNFTQSIETCFKKFSVFEGRARKSEFWWFQLFCVIAQVTGALLDYLLGYSENGAFEWVAYIIILLPSLAVGARRLHDSGRSGWWQLITFTVIGVVPLLVWLASEGTQKNAIQNSNPNIDLVVQPVDNGTSLYVFGHTDGTPSYTAGALTIRIGLQRL